MPDLRMREQTSEAELQAIADQSAERAACLRLAETVADFLSRLRSSAGTLNVPERQRVVRLLVKEILVGDDKIVIRHSIPLPANPPEAPIRTGIHRGQAKTSPEVIFCVQGVITAPCGVPTRRRTSDPLSTTPAVSHLQMQSQQSAVRNPMLEENRHHPFVVDRSREERSRYFGVERPIHPFLMDADPESVPALDAGFENPSRKTPSRKAEGSPPHRRAFKHRRHEACWTILSSSASTRRASCTSGGSLH